MRFSLFVESIWISGINNDEIKCKLEIVEVTALCFLDSFLGLHILHSEWLAKLI